MRDHVIKPHTFRRPVVRETWRHGSHVERQLLVPAVLVRPPVAARAFDAAHV